MRSLILVLVIPTVLLGCSMFKKKGSDEWGEPTPAGYRVEWTDKGTTSGGVKTKPEILALFDLAIDRAQHYLIDKYGADRGKVALFARGTRYHLVDDKRIPTDASGTGFASGITYEGHIQICLMSRRVAASRGAVPSTAPPWTVVDLGDGTWSYGVIDEARPFPALGHELGHRLYGAGFEH